MCPQANVSEIILGGSEKGASKLGELLNENDRRTVGGYIDQRFRHPHTRSGNENQFSLKASQYNEHMPDNFYLIAGDPSLEVQSEAINQLAGVTLPKSNWKDAHSWIKDLAGAIEEKDVSDGAMFFIDCNPSFAAYTKLSIIAADKLLIPCTADGSSSRAIRNIGQLLYGQNVPEDYEAVDFLQKIKKEKLHVPSIHMVLFNRSTEYNKKASKAFGAMFDNIKKEVNALIEASPEASPGDVTPLDNVFLPVPDTHSVAIVSSHAGIPVGELRVGRHEVYDKKPQVNSEPLDRYKEALGTIIEKL